MSLAGHRRYCHCDGCNDLAAWNRRLTREGLAVIDRGQIIKGKQPGPKSRPPKHIRTGR